MKTCVLILGMHRSGTSSLAGSLQQKGLYLGEVYERNPFNLKGNRENARIMSLNEAVLARSSADWRTPPEALAWDDAHLQERNDIIKELIANSDGIWGFKDPRVLFTFPFWKGGLSSIKMVGTVRNPLSVAKSLNFRNQIQIAEGLELWYAYNCKLLELLNEFDFPLISFDVPARQYLASVEFISEFLGLDDTMIQDKDTFFDESLRTHKNQDKADMPKYILKLYDDLMSLTFNS
jgi:hypothetical protein